MRPEHPPPYPKSAKDLYVDDHKTDFDGFGYSESTITRKLRGQWKQLSSTQKQVSLIGPNFACLFMQQSIL